MYVLNTKKRNKYQCLEKKTVIVIGHVFICSADVQCGPKTTQRTGKLLKQES